MEIFHSHPSKISSRHSLLLSLPRTFFLLAQGGSSHQRALLHAPPPWRPSSPAQGARLPSSLGAGLSPMAGPLLRRSASLQQAPFFLPGSHGSKQPAGSKASPHGALPPRLNGVAEQQPLLSVSCACAGAETPWPPSSIPPSSSPLALLSPWRRALFWSELAGVHGTVPLLSLPSAPSSSMDCSSSTLLSMAQASFFRAAEAPPHGAPTPCYIFSQPPLTLPRQPAQGPSSPWRPSPLLPALDAPAESVLLPRRAEVFPHGCELEFLPWTPRNFSSALPVYLPPSSSISLPSLRSSIPPWTPLVVPCA